MKVLALLSFVALSAAAGCAAQAGSTGEEALATADAIEAPPSNDDFYVVTRPDPRDCKAPLCGGWFVKHVNADKTLCADGFSDPECYASAIVLDHAGLTTRDEESVRVAVESGKAIVKASLEARSVDGAMIGTLHVSEAWVAATGSPPSGTVFRTADNGIQCLAAPCPSTGAYALNIEQEHDVIDVVLEQTFAAPAPDAHARAESALRTREGILVAGGVLAPHCLPGPTCGPKVVATEFYLRVKPAR